ncbi:uncharacterized protein DUF3667 [Tenacibaculum adriaticum]|uniref:Uncharacterized protein DUF3667 n=1 Tax=Tenacibaculum adriaticum TaxID=413713 RepID=A0A5S5DW75_9FLAO|nr:DUF3667 domain-containing protein [Tenacibaculum adriaticum]TYP99528.1 uncharacterized protein DUF3667 [Tenacibaculum adriaticum]
MAKKNKLVIIKNSNCLNCGYPFSGQEIFCPECGQKNKGDKLTFGAFLKELFNGLTSWDAKFWKTLIPLLFSPGKVSKDYIEGKRTRYVNPFRFYLTTSIIFFLIIGFTDSYSKLNMLRSGRNVSSFKNVQISKNGIKTVEKPINLDSIQDVVFKEIDKAQKRKDSINSLIALDSLNNINDSIKTKNQADGFNVSLADNKNVMSFLKFQKNNPKISIDTALDSLHMEKTFSNRFWYSRAEVINSFVSKEGESNKFNKQLLSYASISLFILLPLFTFFLRIIYFRRKFTYVEHLVFVFHVQTVFFLLFSIFYLIDFVKDTNYIIRIFLLVFLVYLFIAMKKFYEQGYFKTFLKFILANTLFMIISLFGAIIVSAIAFALY